MIIVETKTSGLTATEAQDRNGTYADSYPNGTSWHCGAGGGLIVLSMKQESLAEYPSGVWSRVYRDEDKSEGGE